MSEEELRWQRRSDARTLAEAEEIKANKERYEQAKVGAKEILEEEANRLRGLSKVVNTNRKKDKKTVSSTQPQNRTRQKGLPSGVPDIFKR